MNEISLNSFKNFIPKRSPDSFKGQNGKVLVIGGSNDFIGAPALSAMAALAALRSGVDIVTVAAPEKAGFIINSFSPDIIVKKFSGKNLSSKHLKMLFFVAKSFDAVLIGPGMGLNKDTQHLIQRIVKKLMRERIPLILDADAIKAVKGMKFNGKVLLTPHKTEFEIFSGKTLFEEKFNLNKRIQTVKELAKKHKCIILLKGKIDIISDGENISLNKTGNPGMTVGGTGDVLAGLCAGLTALSRDLFKSACAAAFINGLAGDNQLKKKGHSFIASDLLHEIPALIKKLSA
ncbi:MAG: NAD(P)H-hydrate dehydratase [Candidatus Diapherotrites archaeon]